MSNLITYFENTSLFIFDFGKYIFNYLEKTKFFYPLENDITE